MLRRSTPLRGILAGLLLVLFGALAATPHTHIPAEHESVVCAGHFDDSGAPDVDHGGACLQCHLGQRVRGVVAAVGSAPTLPAYAPLRPTLPRIGSWSDAIDLDREAPRAPPLRLV